MCHTTVGSTKPEVCLVAPPLVSMVGLFVNLLWNFEIGVTVSLIFSRLESIPERKQTNAQNTYIKILSLQEISFCNGLSFLRMFKGKSRWD